MLPIIGFSLLRNAVRYDYPFVESLESLKGLCEEIFLALGDSSDASTDSIQQISPALRITAIPTVWDENKRKSGIILSEQTNIALREVRKKYNSGWAFYLQADELIHECDIAIIRNDLEIAEKNGCDAVRFRYLHFWQRPDQLAIGKRWYPQEIRAIRIESTIESYGDAQGFRGFSKVYESDASIYHYGHVREEKAYIEKKNNFHRWWHSDQELASVIQSGISKDKNESLLRYLGPHPKVILPRLRKLAGDFISEQWAEVHILGDRCDLNPEFIARIGAKKIHWYSNLTDILPQDPGYTVVLRPLSLYEKISTCFRYRSKVPKKMLSPEARIWPNDFIALLKLSEKGVPCTSL